jgi:hypothetical protein
MNLSNFNNDDDDDDDDYDDDEFRIETVIHGSVENTET